MPLGVVMEVVNVVALHTLWLDILTIFFSYRAEAHPRHPIKPRIFKRSDSLSQSHRYHSTIPPGTVQEIVPDWHNEAALWSMVQKTDRV